MQNLSVEMFNCWLCALITLGHHSFTSCVSEIKCIFGATLLFPWNSIESPGDKDIDSIMAL